MEGIEDVLSQRARKALAIKRAYDGEQRERAWVEARESSELHLLLEEGNTLYAAAHATAVRLRARCAASAFKKRIDGQKSRPPRPCAEQADPNTDSPPETDTLGSWLTRGVVQQCIAERNRRPVSPPAPTANPVFSLQEPADAAPPTSLPEDFAEQREAQASFAAKYSRLLAAALADDSPDPPSSQRSEDGRAEAAAAAVPAATREHRMAEKRFVVDQKRQAVERLAARRWQAADRLLCEHGAAADAIEESWAAGWQTVLRRHVELVPIEYYAAPVFS
ncbi:hypothetical protein DIPPA_27741 [Diplonema papillatum]|nr:hypothetical protein DIPPA_27741 [Diplonema papillatum]|eukprot:gene2943-4632_t